MRALPPLMSTLLAIVLAGPLPAQAGGITYTPGTSQYRVTSLLRQSTEQLGERQEAEIGTFQLVTVAIERGNPDTMRVFMVIDSIDVRAPQPTDLSRFVGIRMAGTMSPRGRIYDLQPPEEHAGDVEVANIVLSMRSLLAGLPASTRAGTTWADTADSNVESAEMDLTRRVITESTLTGDTTYAGQRAQRIEQRISLLMSGTVTAGNASVLMAGEGSGTATHFVTTGGVFLGSRSEMETTIEVSLGEMRMPMRQRITGSVERVR